MPSREEKSRIDAQWQHLQPGWAPKDYEGERKMLYDLLDPGEEIELLHPCSFVTKNIAWGISHDRAVVVATGRRVILLNRGRLSKNDFTLTYLEIDDVTEPEPGRVRLSGPEYLVEFDKDIDSRDGPVFDLDLQFGAAEFSRFVRGHLLSDEETVAAAFSHVLELGEQIQHWARCSAAPESVFHIPGSKETSESWSTSRFLRAALAVVTDQRILFVGAREEDPIASCPHGTVLAVEHTGGQGVRFVDQRGQVYAVGFQGEDDAAPFVSMMREHAAVAQQVSLQPRIHAEWRLQHPIWDFRDDHENERNKLGEILDNAEHLEALLWGRYRPQEEDSHAGVIAATNRRLLFVSNSWDDKHVSQLLLDGIAGVSRDGGRLLIDASPGYAGYLINGLDDMSPHDSREKGQVEVFAARVRSLVADPPHYAATPKSPTEPEVKASVTPESPAEPDVPAANRAQPSEAKRRRVAQQWQQRSSPPGEGQNWDTSTHKNEMSILYEILADDEDIECLIYGAWKEDTPGQRTEWGVIAATDRRLIFAYNGTYGVNVAEFPYSAVASVKIKDGLTDSRITIAGGGARNDWVINGVGDSERALWFTDCVQSLTANPPSLPEAPESLPGAEIPAAVAKRQRVAWQWKERSNGWDPSYAKNEQEKLCEILADDEDIEWLIQCYWKEDIKALESKWGVIAATDHRLIYAYNGKDGAKVAEFLYDAIGSVTMKRGLIDCRVTVAAKGTQKDWVITNLTNGSGRRFVNCVQGHILPNADLYWSR